MRASISPTRSGPEGSSRNEFYSGRCQSLTNIHSLINSILIFSRFQKPKTIAGRFQLRKVELFLNA